jgi:hypothetical protein
VHLNKADSSVDFCELFILCGDAISMHAGAGEKLNFPLGRHLCESLIKILAGFFVF